MLGGGEALQTAKWWIPIPHKHNFTSCQNMEACQKHENKARPLSLCIVLSLSLWGLMDEWSLLAWLLFCRNCVLSGWLSKQFRSACSANVAEFLWGILKWISQLTMRWEFCFVFFLCGEFWSRKCIKVAFMRENLICLAIGMTRWQYYWPCT